MFGQAPRAPQENIYQEQLALDTCRISTGHSEHAFVILVMMQMEMIGKGSFVAQLMLSPSLILSN